MPKTRTERKRGRSWAVAISMRAVTPIAPSDAAAWDQPRSRGLIASSNPIGDSPASARADIGRLFACNTHLVGFSTAWANYQQGFTTKAQRHEGLVSWCLR